MAGKPESSPKSSYSPEEIVFFILILLTVWGIISTWISKNHAVLVTYYNTSIFYLINFFAKYVVFSVFFSIALFVLIIVYSKKAGQIKTQLKNKVLPITGDIKVDVINSIVENAKWKLVQEHIGSDDANKWKLAIIEADIILSELLDSMRLPGSGVGEKLKNIEASDFEHIEEAWEAHKIRNAIAHQGSDFLITQREAKRVIRLYESVFNEFKII